MPKLRLDDVVEREHGEVGYVTQVAGAEQGFEIEEGVTEVLPEMTVRVEWISGENAILGENDVKLVDRPLLVGDTVALQTNLAKRGTVIRSECFADVKFLQSGEVVKDVSLLECLKPICSLEPDLFVIYQHWLGQIFEFTKLNVVVLFDSGVQMKLKTSQVAQLQVHNSEMPTDLPFVAGQRVHYPPNGDGMVLAVIPTRCCVEWIAPSQVHSEEHGCSPSEPPEQEVQCDSMSLQSFLPPSYAATRWRLFQHGILIRPEEVVEAREEEEEEEESTCLPEEAGIESGPEFAADGAAESGAHRKKCAVSKGRFFKHRNRNSRKKKGDENKGERMEADESLREEVSFCFLSACVSQLCKSLTSNLIQS